MPVCAGCWVGEVSAFAEESAVDVEGVTGGGFVDHDILTAEVGGC